MEVLKKVLYGAKPFGHPIDHVTLHNYCFQNFHRENKLMQ